jgi:hypothetical protein
VGTKEDIPMVLKYGVDIDINAIKKNLTRLTNQIYKLLPTWEEALDWQKPLITIIEEFSGMNKLFIDQQDILFKLLCKLEGLTIFTKENDFFDFRRTVFECLSLVSALGDSLCQ